LLALLYSNFIKCAIKQIQLKLKLAEPVEVKFQF